MKVLHLLRHAKSDWDDTALSDHARPLSRRGLTAAKSMGAFLEAERFGVERVFSSTAQRAQDTTRLLGNALKDAQISFHDGLYMTSPEQILTFIHTVAEPAETIMLVGHNPATQDLALHLIGRAARGQRPALDDLRDKYPTGALCTIRFDAPRWDRIAPGSGTLVRFLKPRALPSQD